MIWSKITQVWRSRFSQPDEVAPWVGRLRDDGRSLGPSHRAKGRARAPVEDTTMVLPVPHVGADENYSPLKEIGGQELSPELRRDSDVIGEFHADSIKVIKKMSHDIDDLVADAMERLDKVIDDALANIGRSRV